LRFAVELMRDEDMSAPWSECDGHGEVSNWTSRAKRPGELVLNQDGNSCRYYDFSGACAIALRDGWDAAPYNDGTETKRQQAAKAALADFEYLKAWCEDDWTYVVVRVVLLDDDGEETDIDAYLGGVEYHNSAENDGYIKGVVDDMTGDIIASQGKTWALMPVVKPVSIQTAGV
jgi:hypothetical protein